MSPNKEIFLFLARVVTLTLQTYRALSPLSNRSGFKANGPVVVEILETHQVLDQGRTLSQRFTQQ
jgi:hypothetical protein